MHPMHIHTPESPARRRAKLATPGISTPLPGTTLGHALPFHLFTCLSPHMLFRPLTWPRPAWSLALQRRAAWKFLTHRPSMQGTLVNTSMLCEARTRLVTFQPLPTVTAQLFPREQTLLLFWPFADNICFFFKKKKKRMKRKVLNKPTQLSWEEEHMSNKTHL